MHKLLTLGACLIALMANPVVADEHDRGKGPHGAAHKERMERMRKHLDLSDEQVAQMREIRENGGTRADARAVLTEEQQAKLDELKKRHREKGARPQPTE